MDDTVTVQQPGVAERASGLLDQATQGLFLAAFALFAFKLFWAGVGAFTGPVFDLVLSGPLVYRIGGGLLIAVVVSVAAYVLFGDEERPGWLVLAELPKRPSVAPWVTLMRRAFGVLATFAFLKLVWLAGDDGAGSIDWWHLFGQLLRRF